MNTLDFAPKMTTWSLTGALRQFAEVVQMPPRIQQEWLCHEDGTREWRDVPTVIGTDK